MIESEVIVIAIFSFLAGLCLGKAMAYKSQEELSKDIMAKVLCSLLNVL